MVLDISTLAEEGVDCCRLLVEAGTTEGTGREPEGNMLVAEEVDGIGPSEATCVGADRPGSNIAKALATPISTPLAILVDISSSNFLGSRPININISVGLAITYGGHLDRDCGGGHLDSAPGSAPTAPRMDCTGRRPCGHPTSPNWRHIGLKELIK